MIDGMAAQYESIIERLRAERDALARAVCDYIDQLPDGDVFVRARFMSKH